MIHAASIAFMPKEARAAVAGTMSAPAAAPLRPSAPIESEMAGDVEVSHAGVTNLENQSKRAPSRCRLPATPLRPDAGLRGALASWCCCRGALLW